MAGSNLMYDLAEGNPGALSVVSKLDYPQLAALSKTDLRGQFIWVAYKDICGSNIQTLKEQILRGVIEQKVKDTRDWKYHHGQR